MHFGSNFCSLMFEMRQRVLEVLKCLLKVSDMIVLVQILDETDCISHSNNTLGKGMNPIILPPAMGK